MEGHTSNEKLPCKDVVQLKLVKKINTSHGRFSPVTVVMVRGFAKKEKSTGNKFVLHWVSQHRWEAAI